MDIDTFVEVNGSYVHIGTEQDLYSIIQKYISTELAELVVNFYKQSYDNYKQFTQLLKELSSITADLEITESDCEDYSNALISINNKIHEFKETETKNIDKLIDDIEEIIEGAPI